MDNIVYSSNPNEDSVQTQIDGKFRKISLTRSIGNTEVIYQDNPNVDKVLFTGEDGKKHTATLTASIGNTEVIYQNNPNVDKVLFTGEDGKKHTATLVKEINGGGSTPVIDELNVTPSTSAQTITAPEGVDGYSPVNISAVDASIDENITSGNIKSGVSILGVSGNVVELNGTTASVTPTTSAQTITPTAPSNGFTEVNVSAVTSAIDANIQAGNIKKDVTILGVTGSFEGGTTPTGTKSITANGVYDVTDFASADVQVPTTAPAHYIEKTVDANGKLRNGTTIIKLNGVTDVGDYVLYGAYAYSPISGAVDMSGLTTISGNYACSNMFNGCTGITSADLSSLTTISGNLACPGMFGSCTGITSIDLSGLTTISGGTACQNMFSNCSDLTSIDLSSLTTISGSNACLNMFSNCTGLTTAKLNALNTMSAQFMPSYGQMFGGCTHLESVELGGLTASTFASRKDQLAYLFKNDTGSQAPNGCTVHFPSNFDPSDPNHTFDASTLTGYPTFGGNASYIHVAFDLPATE